MLLPIVAARQKDCLDQCISSLQVTFGPFISKILSFCNAKTIVSIEIIFQNLRKQNILRDFPASLNPDNKAPVHHLGISSSLLLQIKLCHW